VKIAAVRYFDLLMIVTIPLILLLEMCLLVWLALETEEIPAEPWAWSAMVSCGLLAIIFTGWQILRSENQPTDSRILMGLTAAVILSMLLTLSTLRII
jgi:hypothetical protein